LLNPSGIHMKPRCDTSIRSRDIGGIMTSASV
jgi:hypothetical protein